MGDGLDLLAVNYYEIVENIVENILMYLRANILQIHVRIY
jgi:hypothetical protein